MVLYIFLLFLCRLSVNILIQFAIIVEVWCITALEVKYGIWKHECS